MANWRLSNSDNDNSLSKEKQCSSTNNETKQQSKADMIFKFTTPKYKMSELIVSDKVSNDLKLVVNAKKVWKTVFENWGLSSVMKNKENLMVNLYGASGTGKTMAAHAIANELGMQLICVNYADIESKFVGETSKNLTSLFDFAAEKDAIIFFDEADALLSKRVTEMSSATDVSVNQTRSVLLTLLNNYRGMIIFTTNFISNYDVAFMRRIQYHIEFELPDVNLRKKLWRMYIPNKLPTDMDIEYISQKYSNLSGSDISNAVLKAALSAAVMDKDMVPQKEFEDAIESILNAKKENKGKLVSVEQREVSEDYALSQINRKESK